MFFFIRFHTAMLIFVSGFDSDNFYLFPTSNASCSIRKLRCIRPNILIACNFRHNEKKRKKKQETDLQSTASFDAGEKNECNVAN